MSRDGAWINVVMFVLGIVMLAGITKVLLDPGYGSVDEARRIRNPVGFSVIGPRGWGGTTTYGDGRGSIRFAPEKQTGRPISLTFSRITESPPVDPKERPFTFQGEPATILKTRQKYDWSWELRFSRAGQPFTVRSISPIEEDVERGPLMPFINSFRLEMPKTPAVVPLPATLPATTPTTGPAA